MVSYLIMSGSLNRGMPCSKLFKQNSCSDQVLLYTAKNMYYECKISF